MSFLVEMKDRNQDYSISTPFEVFSVSKLSATRVIYGVNGWHYTIRKINLKLNFKITDVSDFQEVGELPSILEESWTKNSIGNVGGVYGLC